MDKKQIQFFDHLQLIKIIIANLKRIIKNYIYILLL